MRQKFVPVLLLAAVALSSSNVLPLDPIAINGQQNDNTFSNKYSEPVYNNIIYTVPIGTSESSRIMRKLAKYLNHRPEEILNDIINVEDNYDGEGFRQEQWHNYPRQLDRLHEYLTHYHNGDIKRNTDTEDPGTKGYEPAESKERILDDMFTDEYPLDSDEGNTLYESIADDTNPLLILKINLARLTNRLKNSQSTQSESLRTQLESERETNGLEEKLFTNEIDPATKVKREGVTSQETGNSGTSTSSKKKKRLFSLWSRLQTLSHKGHELPHRRHLAFYGLPEGEGGGTLTAETRALMRPPGSPLRWG